MGFLRVGIGFLLAGAALAQPPGEVAGVAFGAPATLEWGATSGADYYNVYRGDLGQLASGVPPRCHGYAVKTPSMSTPVDPEPGSGFVFLVTAESGQGEEGTPGAATGGAERALLGRCGPVMRAHVLDRLGYGWDEWSAERVSELGPGGYVVMQLAPETIDEATNAELNARLAVFDPPEDIVELIGRQFVISVYARRQLEQRYAMFWANHFNTYWATVADLFTGAFPPCPDVDPPPQCDPAFPERAYFEATKAQFDELEAFRTLGFEGNFREILEASALGTAMIIYLDTISNVAGAPNENYARELLELYAMGVDGGYTQADVEELARVLTGWTLCKKALPDVGDPLAPCLPAYWEESPPGEIVATFNAPAHDCGPKVLFENTPHELMVPDTCGDPSSGVGDLFMALDAIVAHPATPRFISTKILKRFVTDEPDPALVDALVAVWNDPGNPHGVGDLHAVLAAALDPDTFFDPDRLRGKIKTPWEHYASALRATRGSTNGVDVVVESLVRGQHTPFYNPVPTGYPERGGSWIDTNNTLERQNFGIFVIANDANLTPEFGSDPIGLLADRGVPDTAEAIVDAFADILFGGALTPAERATAIEYLETDDLGDPTPYDASRIRETIGFLLGYPQFQEQ